MKDVDMKLKIYELSKIWSEAEYNFAFGDKLDELDWDLAYKKALDEVLQTKNIFEYYKVLKKFITLLGDGHTDVSFPPCIYNEMGYLPLKIDWIEDQYVLTNFPDQYQGRVRPYSIIKKINHLDAVLYFEKNIYPYCWHEKKDSSFFKCFQLFRLGKIGDSITFELEDPDGNTYTFEERFISSEEVENIKGSISLKAPSIDEMLETVFKSDSHTILKTQDHIAIIIIKTFNNRHLPDEFYKTIDLFKDAKAILFDVRNNGGGNSSNAEAVTSLFLEGSFPVGLCQSRIHIGAVKASGQFINCTHPTYEAFASEYAEYPDQSGLKTIYEVIHRQYYQSDLQYNRPFNPPLHLSQPIAILANHSTCSSAEDFLIMMSHEKRATIIGVPSYGSTGQPLMYNLESGGSFRICTRKCTYPDGTPFINRGVQPDLYIQPTLLDYMNHHDRILEKGLQFLRS